MPFAIAPKSRILFTGDSITDAGRRTDHAPLGFGYVRLVSGLIQARYPKHRCECINTGVGGNTVQDLYHRWTDDVIRHQPDWLSIMVGINDLHRVLRNGPDPVSPQLYADLYDAILRRTREETSAKIILLEPFYMSRDHRGESFRARVLALLPRYTRVVRQLSKKHRTRLVRTHDLYQEALRFQPAETYGTEPVHPHLPVGHLVIAHGWLKAVGW